MKALIDVDDAPVFGIPTRDGLGVCEGALIEGPQGWGEFSPPPDCDDREAQRWLTAAIEGGTVGWPDPVRGRIPIAVSVPAVSADLARSIVADADCRTADVTVAARPDSFAEDVDRVSAVRDALGAGGRIRLSANGMWTAAAAIAAIPALTRAAGELEFIGQPCRTVEDLTAVRRGVDVPVAAEVASAVAADIAILRTGPLGGVRRALRMAELCGLPCVVSSGMETSIGLTSGLALAGALSELPYACALGTASLLAGDVVATRRALIPTAGYLPVAPMPAAPDPELLRRYAITDPRRLTWWRARLRSAHTAG